MGLSMLPSRFLTQGSDRELTVLAVAGNREAFVELVNRNYHRSSQVALSILSNRSSLEDVMSESLCKAYMHLNQLVGGQFSPWFNRIVINESYQHLRGAYPRKQLSLDNELALDRLGAIVSSEGSPESQAGCSELARLLSEEIDRLPLHLKTPLLMNLHQRSVTEIGQELGISESAAKSRLFRARNLLKRRLQRLQPLRYRKAA